MPQSSGSSLCQLCVFHLSAKNRHFAAEIVRTRLFYYTAKSPFFQITASRFLLKPPEKGRFSQTINRKKPLTRVIFQNKTPGSVCIALYGQIQENTRIRVRLPKIRTFHFSHFKSIRFSPLCTRQFLPFFTAYPSAHLAHKKHPACISQAGDLYLFLFFQRRIAPLSGRFQGEGAKRLGTRTTALAVPQSRSCDTL